MLTVHVCRYTASTFDLWLCLQLKKRDVLRRDDEDGDSILSSDTGSTKRKRYAAFQKLILNWTGGSQHT